MSVSVQIGQLFAERGDSEYGGEAVTQREHALQCALLAEQSEASTSLIVASLLHDVGHLLHDLPDDAPDEGIDDAHENVAVTGFWREIADVAEYEPLKNLKEAAELFAHQVGDALAESGWIAPWLEPTGTSNRRTVVTKRRSRDTARSRGT